MMMRVDEIDPRFENVTLMFDLLLLNIFNVIQLVVE